MDEGDAAVATGDHSGAARGNRPTERANGAPFDLA